MFVFFYPEMPKLFLIGRGEHDQFENNVTKKKRSCGALTVN